MATKQNPPLETADYVAQRLKLSVPQVYRLARQGTLPAVRLGHSVRFDPEAIERVVKGGGKVA